jgi:hypothetical protein
MAASSVEISRASNIMIDHTYHNFLAPISGPASIPVHSTPGMEIPVLPSRHSIKIPFPDGI